MTGTEIILLMAVSAMAGVAIVAFVQLGRTLRQLNEELEKPQLALGGQSDVCKDEDWMPFGGRG